MFGSNRDTTDDTRSASDHDTTDQFAALTPAQQWNHSLLEHGGHLLQSWEWGELKSRHGWRAERVAVRKNGGEGYAQILFRMRGPVSIGYIPRGPLIVGNADGVWPSIRDELMRCARQYRAILIMMEPDRPLGLTGTYADAGLLPGMPHMQPSRTVRVPLLDDEALLKQMHSKTRYSVRLALRRGVDIERVTESDGAAFDTYYGLMEDTADRNEFAIHSRAYYRDFLDIFGEHAWFAFAKYEGVPNATVISASFGDEAIYMYGASSTENRGHGAAFLLQYEAMRWARERGCDRYDLWGIPPVDPDSPVADDQMSLAGSKGSDWRGIYRFKTGFGGHIECMPPTYELDCLPVLPWLVRKSGVLQA